MTSDIKIVNVPINQIKPAKYNPRKWDNQQIEALKASIQKFGIVDPLIVNIAPKRTGTLIGGHFRWYVAKELGYKQVPVVYVNIPDIEKEKELNIRLNKNTGEWDLDLLSDFDDDLLKDIGFDSKELDRIFQLDNKPEDDDAPATPKKTNIKTGDIYQLGNHRIMCGDSTKKDDIDKLMNGKLADMMFTDPPYGVDLGKKNRFLNSFQPYGRNLTSYFYLLFPHHKADR